MSDITTDGPQKGVETFRFNDFIASFDGVKNERIRRIFQDTLMAYPPLQNRRIILRQTSFAKTTMRAQPVLNRDFWHRRSRSYRVDYNNRTQLDQSWQVEEASEEVLRGWFAHELGHIMDYLRMPVWKLILFGLGYITSSPFRSRAERRADLFAIKHGFSGELIATKHFILKEAGLSESYLKRIQKYYLSPEQIEVLAAEGVDVIEEKLKGWRERF